MWEPEQALDGDKIKCRICGKIHELTQGTVDGVRIGDGILFYKCGDREYIGAVNKKTILGINICE